jgi:hypothetical protein
MEFYGKLGVLIPIAATGAPEEFVSELLRHSSRGVAGHRTWQGKAIGSEPFDA